MLPRSLFGCLFIRQRMKIRSLFGLTMLISVALLVTYSLLPWTLAPVENHLPAESTHVQKKTVLAHGTSGDKNYKLAINEYSTLVKHHIVIPGPVEEISVSEKNTSVSTLYKGCKRRLPNALLAGFHKCGTNTLMHFLKFHPAISAVLKPPEVHFFSEYFHLGLEWYRNRMTCSFPEQITIECSPDYAYTPKVPERVYKTNKNMQIIFILRNPVDAIISHYTMKVLENRTLHPSINRKPLRHFLLDKNGNIDVHSVWIKEYTYYKHLEHWLKYFSVEQMHVVDGDQFAHCPFKEVEMVERFLDVRPYFKENDFVFNKTKGFYCLQMYNRTWCNGPRKGRHHLRVEKALQDKLYFYFEKENEMLFQLLGRRFNWTQQEGVLKRCT